MTQFSTIVWRRRRRGGAPRSPSMKLHVSWQRPSRVPLTECTVADSPQPTQSQLGRKVSPDQVNGSPATGMGFASPASEGPVVIVASKDGARYVRSLGITNVDLWTTSFPGTNSRTLSLAYLVRSIVCPVIVWQVLRHRPMGLALSASFYPPDVIGAL